MTTSDNPTCDCMECKIRAACGFKKDEPVDIGPAVMALGNVFAELLAFTSSKEAKRFTAELLVARRKWLKEPRVAVQQDPAGRA